MLTLDGDLSYLPRASVAVQDGGGVLVRRRHVESQVRWQCCQSDFEFQFFASQVQGGYFEARQNESVGKSVATTVLLFAAFNTLCMTSNAKVGPFVPSIPNGSENGCLNCHRSESGGDARNTFGLGAENDFLVEENG